MTTISTHICDRCSKKIEGDYVSLELSALSLMTYLKIIGSKDYGKVCPLPQWVDLCEKCVLKFKEFLVCEPKEHEEKSSQSKLGN